MASSVKYPSQITSRLTFLFSILLISVPRFSSAQEGPTRIQVVIETDAGLDDVVALSLCLQEPRIQVRALILSDGVLNVDQGAVVISRLLSSMDRREIPVYAPPAHRAPRPAPPFRPGVVRTLMEGLVETIKPVQIRPLKEFSLKPPGPAQLPLTLLALGPTGSLARLLRTKPAMKKRFERVVASGAPGPSRSWNARFNPEAWAAVARSGLTVQYLVHGPAAKKPRSWATRPPPENRGDVTPAAALLKRLLSRPKVARHYAAELSELTDELPLFFLLKPSLFTQRGTAAGGEGNSVFYPAGRQGLFSLFRKVLLLKN